MESLLILNPVQDTQICFTASNKLQSYQRKQFPFLFRKKKKCQQIFMNKEILAMNNEEETIQMEMSS